MKVSVVSVLIIATSFLFQDHSLPAFAQIRPADKSSNADINALTNATPPNRKTMIRSSSEDTSSMVQPEIRTDVRSAQTEMDLLQGARLRLSPDGIVALDKLRENPIVRFWDGEMAKGYTVTQRCYPMLLDPCQPIITDSRTGEELKLPDLGGSQIVATGIGKEVVRAN